MENRVVITGLGVISSVGSGIDENWSNIVNGNSGIDTISQFDTGDLPVKVACEVKDFKPKSYINDRKSLKIMYRNVQLGLAAGKLVIDDSGLDTEKVDPLRFGVITGSSGGGFDEGPGNKDLADVIKASWCEEKKNFDAIKFGSDSIGKLYPLWLLKTLPNNVFCYLSIYYNAQGINDNIIGSFAGGAQAIGDAFTSIKRGDADVMIAGGYETLVMPNNLYTFHMLNMMQKDPDSKTAFRPFDKLRQGFTLGEGAGMVMLEEASHAKKRGAKIYGEIAGYGNASNAQHLYETRLDGKGLKTAVKFAMENSSINMSDVNYINADGIATVESDRTETNVIKELFNDSASKLVVSSTKPATGHVGAAAGAIELILSTMAIDKGVIPPTLNLQNADPECDLDYCPNTAREMNVNAALSLNQGFGGINTALLVKKFD